jgi:hypothetical protein
MIARGDFSILAEVGPNVLWSLLGCPEGGAIGCRFAGQQITPLQPENKSDGGKQQIKHQGEHELRDGPTDQKARTIQLTNSQRTAAVSPIPKITNPDLMLSAPKYCRAPRAESNDPRRRAAENFPGLIFGMSDQSSH